MTRCGAFRHPEAPQDDGRVLSMHAVLDRQQHDDGERQHDRRGFPEQHGVALDQWRR